MAEVLAGFVCGFALSIIDTPPFAVWIVKARDDIPFIRNAVPKGMAPTLLSVPISSFFFLMWTGLGLVYGMVLIAAENSHPNDGLASPNLLYTLFILITAVIVFLPFYALIPSARRLALFLVLTYVALFGWATPYLAHYASNHVS
jgi:hypothetical protein